MRTPRRDRSEGARPPVIELHIRELVLHGFSPHDRHAIGDAVARELTRMLARPEAMRLFESGRALDRVDGGAVSIRADARGDLIGRSLASAIYGGLQR